MTRPAGSGSWFWPAQARVGEARSDRRDNGAVASALGQPSVISQSFLFGFVPELSDVLIGQILGESAVHDGPFLLWIVSMTVAGWEHCGGELWLEPASTCPPGPVGSAYVVFTGSGPGWAS